MVDLMASYSSSDVTVRADALSRFEALCAGQSISASVRSAALVIAVKADDRAFERLIELHSRTDDAKLRTEIYAALARAPSVSRRRQALDWALTETIRAQDLFLLPAGFYASGRDGPELVFAWVREHYADICRRLPPGGILFQEIVRLSGAGYASEEDAAAVAKFWEDKPVYGTIRKTVNQTVEKIQSRTLR